MKINEITDGLIESGPKQGWKSYCKNTPRDKMSASWRSSCVARGKIARRTGKSQLIGKKREKLGDKKRASTKYGGPVSPTRAG